MNIINEYSVRYYIELRGYRERDSPISRGWVSIRNLHVPNYLTPRIY